MFWIARIWGRRKANRYMTLGLKPGSRPGAGQLASPAITADVASRGPTSESFAPWKDHHVTVFATVPLVVIALNLLALANASGLIPCKLALVPASPCPRAPAKVAAPGRRIHRGSAALWSAGNERVGGERLQDTMGHTTDLSCRVLHRHHRVGILATPSDRAAIERYAARGPALDRVRFRAVGCARPASSPAGSARRPTIHLSSSRPQTRR